MNSIHCLKSFHSSSYLPHLIDLEMKYTRKVAAFEGCTSRHETLLLCVFPWKRKTNSPTDGRQFVSIFKLAVSSTHSVSQSLYISFELKLSHWKLYWANKVTETAASQLYWNRSRYIRDELEQQPASIKEKEQLFDQGTTTGTRGICVVNK